MITLEQGLATFGLMFIAMYLAVILSHVTVTWWSGRQYRRKVKQDSAVMKDVLEKQAQYIQQYQNAYTRPELKAVQKEDA